MERAKRIQCPAPLPEETVISRLAKMLVPAPYKAPEKKAKGAKGGPRHMGTSDVTSEDEETHSSVPQDEEEEEEIPPRDEGREKRAASMNLGGGDTQEEEGLPCG